MADAFPLGHTGGQGNKPVDRQEEGRKELTKSGEMELKPQQRKIPNLHQNRREDAIKPHSKGRYLIYTRFKTGVEERLVELK